MEERTIKFEIVIEGECTPEEQSKVRKMYDFVNEYADDKGYSAIMTAGVKELMEKEEKNTVAVKVDVDTSEALKQMREVTEAANECVAALEKLERLTNKFSGFPQARFVNISPHEDNRVRTSF
ncbi:hypothetical protein [Bacillus pseudomycoides]|uniref:hypothetical protein n=1 Tax=Bacillus pseudomycoides TaxID=64104 RepID=UPI000BFB397A|nr:hypothetical protein [Bacillus pseudomycoides]PHB24767.1 hypothetical protein COE80_17205 [Bacillus pseudomycoides]PHG24661.1 hypothetical protein COI47_07675 [Bacillus pseudomycoides]